jgi:KUP system potassium uptake protein
MSPLVVGAIGVVFGDIGTSPLYTLRQCFGGEHHLVTLTPANVLGILSIIFWALMIIVTVKYVMLIMRADNRGEGGILALTALVSRGLGNRGRRRWWLVGFGIVGAAMFYGDGMITPAISVLGAVEGLEIIAPDLHPFIVPVTVAIVSCCSPSRTRHREHGPHVRPGDVRMVRRAGVASARISSCSTPAVLVAIDPRHAFAFISHNPRLAFLSLGAVVLAVTGTEALYADMGHFGATPIRRAWLWFVMPALVLNYFGQGALLLLDPSAIKNRSTSWRRNGR